MEGIPIQNNFNDHKAIPSKTKLSETISKDLKQRGFHFVGPRSFTLSCKPLGWSTTTSWIVLDTVHCKVKRADRRLVRRQCPQQDQKPEVVASAAFLRL